MSLPPGFSSSVAERSISFRASISWFTSMRSAWKSFAISFFSRSRLKRGSTAAMKSLVVLMGLRGSCLDQCRGDAARVLQLAVEIEDVGKGLFLIFVHDVGSSLARSLVHAHVEWRVEAEGESAGLVIEVMARYAEVG